MNPPTDKPRFLPFDECRICIKAVIAGIHGVNGNDHPHCLGPACSNFWECAHEDLLYWQEYNALKSGKEPEKSWSHKPEERE